MATAKNSFGVVEVEKVITELVTTNTVILTLTLAEAEALVKLLANVGGNPSTTRGKLDNIASALAEVGVDRADVPIRGSVYFED